MCFRVIRLLVQRITSGLEWSEPSIAVSDLAEEVAGRGKPVEDGLDGVRVCRRVARGDIRCHELSKACEGFADDAVSGGQPWFFVAEVETSMPVHNARRYARSGDSEGAGRGSPPGSRQRRCRYCGDRETVTRAADATIAVVRSVLLVVLPSVVGACVAVYLAAVGLNGDVASTADWWPYPWLWVLAVIALACGVWWLVLMLRRGATSEPASAAADATSEAGLSSEPAPTPAPVVAEAAAPVPETAPGLETVVEWGDMRATRAANGTWGVRWMSSNQPVGTITPIGQGFYHARHIHMGDAGQHASIEEALRGIWQVD